MNDDELLQLEDWKMTKDRIKHFDDIIMRTRIGGLPIATGLQAAAFLTSNSIGKITPDIFPIEIPIFSLIMIASILYLIPVFLFDILHFQLLLKAVDHARNIESRGIFKNNLEITTKLTSHKLTTLHRFAGYGIYIIVLSSGLGFAIFGSTFIDSLDATFIETSSVKEEPMSKNPENTLEKIPDEFLTKSLTNGG